MKLNKLLLQSFILIIGFTSCSNDNDPKPDEKPIEINADGEFFEEEIATGEELWFKVTCEAGSTAATLEWSEKDAHGTSRSYTANIVVSAYQMDGITAYIENKDNGYKEDGKTFDLANDEVQFLVKVVVGSENIDGSFALRVKTSSDITVSYTDLAVGDTWTEVSNIEQGSIVGYKVSSTAGTEYQIIWAESGTAGFSYTADVKGSVLNKDANQYYTVANGGTGLFQEKNKSYGDGDVKSIVALADENNFKIHIKGVVAGSYAIKVIEVAP